MRADPPLSPMAEGLSGAVSSVTVASEARLRTPFVRTTEALTVFPGG